MLKDKHSKKSIISTLELVESIFYRELIRNGKKRVYTAKHLQMLAEERRKMGHYKTLFSTKIEIIILAKKI